MVTNRGPHTQHQYTHSLSHDTLVMTAAELVVVCSRALSVSISSSCSSTVPPPCTVPSPVERGCECLSVVGAGGGCAAAAAAAFCFRLSAAATLFPFWSFLYAVHNTHTHKHTHAKVHMQVWPILPTDPGTLGHHFRPWKGKLARLCTLECTPGIWIASRREGSKHSTSATRMPVQQCKIAPKMQHTHTHKRHSLFISLQTPNALHNCGIHVCVAIFNTLLHICTVIWETRIPQNEKLSECGVYRGSAGSPHWNQLTFQKGL